MSDLEMKQAIKMQEEYIAKIYSQVAGAMEAQARTMGEMDRILNLEEQQRLADEADKKRAQEIREAEEALAKVERVTRLARYGLVIVVSLIFVLLLAMFLLDNYQSCWYLRGIPFTEMPGLWAKVLITGCAP